MNYELDNERIYTNILRKLNRNHKMLKHLQEENIMSRNALFRLRNGSDMKISTILKVINWLGGDIDQYFKKV